MNLPPKVWDKRTCYEAYYGCNTGLYCTKSLILKSLILKLVRNLPQNFADAIAHRVATFGRGTCLSILLDSVTCSGSESRLLDCPSNPVGVHDCSHSEDAGVQCAVSGMLVESDVAL